MRRKGSLKILRVRNKKKNIERDEEKFKICTSKPDTNASQGFNITISKNDVNFFVKSMLFAKNQYTSYKRKKLSLSAMMFYIILFFFLSCCLLIGNSQKEEIIKDNFKVYLLIVSFWGGFGFALIEASILLYAELVQIVSLRYLIIAFNTGTTLISALLFSIDPDYWSNIAHWIEYSAQFSITLLDILFIFHHFQHRKNILYRYRYYELALVIFFSILGIFKILAFGEYINFGIGGWQAAHFFEYTGDIVNSFFAFVFTYVMYQESEDNFQAFLIFEEESIKPAPINPTETKPHLSSSKNLIKFIQQ